MCQQDSNADTILRFTRFIMGNKSCINTTLSLLVFFLFSFVLASCDDEADYPDEPQHTDKTIFMYLPWSGDDIYDYFLDNISHFEAAIENNYGLNDNRLIVFIANDESKAEMFEITYDNGSCQRNTLKDYIFSAHEFTTAEGISEIIKDVITKAPAESYAMTIGCHGMGWIPAGTPIRTRTAVPSKDSWLRPLTRFFGHWSNGYYQTDITTLAEGIRNAGVKMEYILFDDCYMANIETAYDLKDVTNYLIASTCEIMIYGMPYEEIGVELLNNDYWGIVDDFYNFYSTYHTPNGSYAPYGTISVTDCREIETTAQLMRQINTAHPEGVETTDGLQPLDGLQNTIFFDLGDYVDKLCKDEALAAAFRQQLDRLVPYKRNTEYFYSTYKREDEGTTKINAFSGLTISDPSINSTVNGLIEQTNWYTATH